MPDDDILDTIDHALEDYSVSLDAMRWSPEADASTFQQQRNSAPAVSGYMVDLIFERAYPENREPVFHHDTFRSGRTTIPFVGGPWHMDVREMESPLRRNVVAPRAMGGSIFEPGDDSSLCLSYNHELYTLTPVTSHVHGHEPVVFWVYRHSSVDIGLRRTHPELIDAVQHAFLEGFDPRLQRSEAER